MYGFGSPNRGHGPRIQINIMVDPASILLLVLATWSCSCEATELSCTDDEETEYCVNDQVQYQCRIPGDDVVMRWQVLDSINGSLIHQETLATGDSIDADIIDDDFESTLISNSNPLISNISFSTRFSFDNYVLQCEEYGKPAQSCTIYIAGTGH